jgi:hypothetical protein
MRGILADNDVEGFVKVMLAIWLGEPWRDIWKELDLEVRSFADVGLSRESSDAAIWRVCQLEKLVLITGNRNSDEPDSLEAVIRAEMSNRACQR